MNDSFKIILVNVQAGVGVTRGYWQYLTLSWRYFFKHRFDVRALKDYIATEQVDVAVLTETSATLGYTDSSQLALDVSGLPNHASAEYTLWKIFRLGNFVATRYGIKEVRTHHLPSVRERRPLLEVDMNVNGRGLKLFASHFSLVKGERARQIAFIIDLIKTSQEPVVLAADFNTNDDAELLPLLEAGLKKVSLPTYPSWHPTKTFDHIFISDHLVLVACSVPPLLISDHLPLVVELRFK